MLAGKATKEASVGLVFITGYNRAEIGEIKEVTLSSGNKTPVLEIYVYDTAGTKKEKPESMYLLTKDGDINLNIINMLIKAIDPSAQQIPEGYQFTEQDEAQIKACKGKAVALLMFPKKNKEGKVFHNTSAYGFEGNTPCIEHISKAGMAVDIAVKDAPTAKTSTQKAEENGNAVLR